MAIAAGDMADQCVWCDETIEEGQEFVASGGNVWHVKCADDNYMRLRRALGWRA